MQRACDLATRIPPMKIRSKNMNIRSASRLIIALTLKALPSTSDIALLQTNSLPRTIEAFLAKWNGVTLLPIFTIPKLKILFCRKFQLKRLILLFQRNVFVLNGYYEFTKTHDFLLQIQGRRLFHQIGYSFKYRSCFREIQGDYLFLRNPGKNLCTTRMAISAPLTRTARIQWYGLRLQNRQRNTRTLTRPPLKKPQAGYRRESRLLFYRPST